MHGKGLGFSCRVWEWGSGEKLPHRVVRPKLDMLAVGEVLPCHADLGACRRAPEKGIGGRSSGDPSAKEGCIAARAMLHVVGRGGGGLKTHPPGQSRPSRSRGTA